MAKRNILGPPGHAGMVALISPAKYCCCHVGVGLLPLVLLTNGVYSWQRGL